METVECIPKLMHCLSYYQAFAFNNRIHYTFRIVCCLPLNSETQSQIDLPNLILSLTDDAPKIPSRTNKTPPDTSFKMVLDLLGPSFFLKFEQNLVKFFRCRKPAATHPCAEVAPVR